ncbi:MAG: DNA-3-methyladenine glycosylase [Oscillospiraceae bacterium]
MARLSREFYSGNTVETAQNLLGKVLVRQWKGRFLAGRITETEAYIGRCDKACHAYHYRRTARTETLFLAPGHAYIYLIYGMYHCLNFVTEPEGEPAAVLVRSVEPVAGTEWMQQLRYGGKAAYGLSFEKLFERSWKGLPGFFPDQTRKRPGPDW